MNSTRNVQFRLPQYEYLANGTYRDPLKRGATVVNKMV